MVQEARALTLNEVDLHLVHRLRRRTTALPLPLQQQGLSNRAHERRPASRPRRNLPVGKPGIVAQPPPPGEVHGVERGQARERVVREPSVGLVGLRDE